MATASDGRHEMRDMRDRVLFVCGYDTYETWTNDYPKELALPRTAKARMEELLATSGGAGA